MKFEILIAGWTSYFFALLQGDKVTFSPYNGKLNEILNPFPSSLFLSDMDRWFKNHPSLTIFYSLWLEPPPHRPTNEIVIVLKYLLEIPQIVAVSTSNHQKDILPKILNITWLNNKNKQKYKFDKGNFFKTHTKRKIGVKLTF